MSTMCKECPYFYNKTYNGECEQVIDKCEKRQKDVNIATKNKGGLNETFDH